MKLSDAIESVINEPHQRECPVCIEMSVRAIARIGTFGWKCFECPFRSMFMQQEFNMWASCEDLRERLKISSEWYYQNKSVYESVKFVREMMMNLRSIGD